MDSFFQNVVSQDIRARIQAHADLCDYLSNPSCKIACEDFDKFVDGLASWVNSSNFKISLNGLEILSLLVNRMGESFKNYVPSVCEPVMNRLGDMKDEVRDSAVDLLLRFMHPASSPNAVFDRISVGFGNKQWRIREGVCICLQNALNHYGAKSLQLTKLVPLVVKLLDDQNTQVRDAAANTLVEIYRHVGERVRADLSKKGLGQIKLSALFERFDEVRLSGNMVPTADFVPKATDDTDFSRPPVFKAPAAASATVKRAPSAVKKVGTSAAKPSGGPSSGSVDEEQFVQSFEQVPKIAIYSPRDIDDKISSIQAALSDPNEDWEKRVTSLKMVRAIVLAGGGENEDFLQALRQLDVSLQISVKDLRSQVVREACVTIAFLARQYTLKFDRFAEMLLVHLINLIPNSAKVMATSGGVAVRFIIQYVHSPRLIPIITQQLASKANQIRRHICEVLELMCMTWPTYTLEKHTAALQDAIKRAIADADAEARASARRAFWAFANHFKDQADALYDSLDAVRQKQLQGELSASSSGNSITAAAVAAPAPPRGGSGTVRSRSQERDLASDGVDEADAAAAGGIMFVRGGSRRSDRRALTPKSSGASSLIGLARPRKSSSGTSVASGTPMGLQASALSPDDGTTRQIPRTSFSQRDSAQPAVPDAGSRSSSPATKLFASINSASSAANGLQPLPTLQGLPQRRKSGIPRSQGASRESSPSRGTGQSAAAGGFDRGVNGRMSLTTSAPPRRVAAGSLASGQSPTSALLQAGRDAEELVAQKLRGSMRRRFDAGTSSAGGAGSDDDASETSSVCSETLSTFGGRLPDDVSEIVTNMASPHWSERKEGLLQLHYYVTNVRTLNKAELKKVTEIFTKMFYDPHNKVFSVFMDTLVEVVVIHKHELKDWLYMLLTRLLTKCGSDMLASVASKVYRSLDVTREVFENMDQFQAITKFMIDQTQTPNLKVKLQLLNYLHALVGQMDETEFVSNADSKLALSKIISWVGEPKSADIRRAAQTVLVALFNLNAVKFSSLLSELPKAFQDGATKALQSSIQGVYSGADVPVSPSSSQAATDACSPKSATPLNAGSSRISPHHKLPTPRYRLLSDVEMNAEDVYHSIRKTTADIESLSLSSKLDDREECSASGGYGGGVRERDSASQDSGIQSSLPDVRVDSPDAHLTYHGGSTGPRKGYNPSLYQESSRHHNGGPLYAGTGGMGGLRNIGGGGDDGDLASEELPMDPSDALANIVVELSNHDRRSKERHAALLQLVTLTREGTLTHWDEHFKTVLLLLLETLGDEDGNIRANALRALREIIKHQRHRFEGYAELTILKILDAHKDPCRDVVVVAEDCASTLAQSLAPEHCVRVLCQISQSDEYPVNLAAIKMETKVIELLSKAAVEKHISDMVPGLLKGYSHSESTVRKASVFALVALYMHVGERLKDQLGELNSSKIKLLNVYISRALNKKNGGAAGAADGGDVV